MRALLNGSLASGSCRIKHNPVPNHTADRVQTLHVSLPHAPRARGADDYLRGSLQQPAEVGVAAVAGRQKGKRWVGGLPYAQHKLRLPARLSHKARRLRHDLLRTPCPPSAPVSCQRLPFEMPTKPHGPLPAVQSLQHIVSLPGPPPSVRAVHVITCCAVICCIASLTVLCCHGQRGAWTCPTLLAEHVQLKQTRSQPEHPDTHRELRELAPCPTAT